LASVSALAAQSLLSVVSTAFVFVSSFLLEKASSLTLSIPLYYLSASVPPRSQLLPSCRLRLLLKAHSLFNRSLRCSSLFSPASFLCFPKLTPYPLLSYPQPISSCCGFPEPSRRRLSVEPCRRVGLEHCINRVRPSLLGSSSGSFIQLMSLASSHSSVSAAAALQSAQSTLSVASVSRISVSAAAAFVFLSLFPFSTPSALLSLKPSFFTAPPLPLLPPSSFPLDTRPLRALSSKKERMDLELSLEPRPPRIS